MRKKKIPAPVIREIKSLKSKGVRIHLLARIIKADYGVSKSATYYHIGDNDYSNQAKRIRQLQKEKIRERIYHLIEEEGKNTGQISREWNVPLKVLNRIYTT